MGGELQTKNVTGVGINRYEVGTNNGFHRHRGWQIKKQFVIGRGQNKKHRHLGADHEIKSS